MRSPSLVRSLVVELALLVTLLNLAALAAPTARADAVDDSFLQSLKVEGHQLRVVAGRDRRRS